MLTGWWVGLGQQAFYRRMHLMTLSMHLQPCCRTQDNWRMPLIGRCTRKLAELSPKRLSSVDRSPCIFHDRQH